MISEKNLTSLIEALSEDTPLMYSTLLGELTNGLVHDMNNSLAIILGYAEKIQTSPESAPTSIDKVIRHAKKITDLLIQVRTFYKGNSESKPASIGLSKLLETPIALISPKFKSLGIQFEVDEIPNCSVMTEFSSSVKRLTHQFYVFALKELKKNKKILKAEFVITKNKVEIHLNSEDKSLRFTYDLVEKSQQAA